MSFFTRKGGIWKRCFIFLRGDKKKAFFSLNVVFFLFQISFISLMNGRLENRGRKLWMISKMIFAIQTFTSFLCVLGIFSFFLLGVLLSPLFPKFETFRTPQKRVSSQKRKRYRRRKKEKNLSSPLIFFARFEKALPVFLPWYPSLNCERSTLN